MNQRIYENVTAQAASTIVREVGQNMTPAISIKFILSKREEQYGDMEEPREETMIWDGWLTPACFDRTMNSIEKAFGIKTDEEFLDKVYSTPEIFEGKKVSLAIDEEEYKGKKKKKIAFINPLNTAKAIEKEKYAGVRSQFLESIKKYRAGQAAAGSEPPVPGEELAV